MARRRMPNPPLTGRRPRRGAASGMPAGRYGRGTRTDLTAQRLMHMDAVLLDPQRLYDATWCSPDEFDYILHLYEGWLERNRQRHLFRSEGADGRASRGTIHPRHALLMLLADKRANVPMEMLADLFGTDIDGVSTYLTITDEALTEVLPGPVMGGAKPDLSAANLTNFNLQVPMAALGDPIRPRTARNYPGLLPDRRTSGGTGPDGADAAGRRVEEARAARAALDAGERLMQYRRLTDPYTGYPGLDIELAVISRLENLHVAWAQTRRENGPLLLTLAKKRDFWGVA